MTKSTKSKILGISVRGFVSSKRAKVTKSAKPLLLLEYVALQNKNLLFYLFETACSYSLAEQRLKQILDNQSYKILEDYHGLQLTLHCTLASVLNVNLVELQTKLILSGFHFLDLDLDKELICYTNLQLIKQLPKTF